MAENPRKRLAKLMDDLELPKGFRLTPARESTLRELGVTLLTDGDLTCYHGDRPTYRALNNRWRRAHDWSSQEKAAFRAMGIAKWITLGPPADPQRAWGSRRVLFQPGLEALAKRLGARQILWEERRKAHTAELEDAHSKVRDKVWKARQTLNQITNDPMDRGEHDVLKAFKTLQALSLEADVLGERLQAARDTVNGVQEPTEDEALTYLMMRELSKDAK